MRRLLVACVVAVVAAVAVSLVSAAPETAPAGRWAIRDLGTFGLRESRAVAVNERGQVVVDAGESWDGRSYYGGRAFLWEKGRVTPLGDLGGGETTAVAINDRGMIVGFGRTAKGERHAFLWNRGRMTDLGTLPGDAVSDAVDVNDRGQVAVNSYASDRADLLDQSHAFVWASTRRRTLGALPGAWWSHAVAIDEQGRIAGTSRPTYKAARRVTSWAFIWENGHMRALPTPRGRQSSVVAINDRGHVVGMVEKRGTVLWRNRGVIVIGEWTWSTPAGALNDRDQVVFVSKLWQSGRTVDLGIDHGVDINEPGQVIGWDNASYTDPGDPQSSSCTRAMVWQRGEVVDLGTLRAAKSCTVEPHESTMATALNDQGLIVGLSRSNGRDHAVVWARRG